MVTSLFTSTEVAKLNNSLQSSPAMENMSVNKENLQQKDTNQEHGSVCTESASKAVDVPDENDILLGRGAGVNSHPGNVHYRKLIQNYKVQYVNSDPAQKKLIMKHVFNIVKQTGRFLRLDPSTEEWTIVSDEESKKKVGQALREKAPMIKNQYDQEVLKKRKLEFQTSESSSIPRNIHIHPFSILNSVLPHNDQKLNQINGNSTANSQFPPSSQTSCFVQMNHLLYQINVLKERQNDLKREQRDLEDDQSRLIQHLNQMVTEAIFDVPSSSESWSDENSDNEHCFTQSPKKQRRFF